MRHKKEVLDSIKLKARQNPNNKRALAFVSDMDYKNLTLREIAEKLNRNEFKTSTGKMFGTTQVIRILKKITD